MIKIHNKVTNNYCMKMHYDVRAHNRAFAIHTHTWTNTEKARKRVARENEQNTKMNETKIKSDDDDDDDRRNTRNERKEANRRCGIKRSAQRFYSSTNREREGCACLDGKHQPTSRILSYYYYFFGDLSLSLSVSCLLYTSPSPRDATLSRMPSSA